MEIRRIRESELPPLVDDLWTPFAREMAEDDPYYTLTEGFREDVLAYRRERFADADTTTRVAVDDGELVGYVAGEYREAPPVHRHGDVLHVDEVYVRPADRREGLGTALLERAMAWGTERGCSHVTLNVNRPNESAQALYRDLGFEVKRYNFRKPIDD